RQRLVLPQHGAGHGPAVVGRGGADHMVAVRTDPELAAMRQQLRQMLPDPTEGWRLQYSLLKYRPQAAAMIDLECRLELYATTADSIQAHTNTVHRGSQRML